MNATDADLSSVSVLFCRMLIIGQKFKKKTIDVNRLYLIKLNFRLSCSFKPSWHIFFVQSVKVKNTKKVFVTGACP